MGKSSKKSTPKVDAVPAVTLVSKSTKKGKREAEKAAEKLVSAKKQKIDEGVKQAVQKKKVLAKTQKKKKEESSSSDDSSSDEEQKAKVVIKNVQKAIKPPVKESSSDESSSDEEEAPPKTALPSKKLQTAAKNGSVGAPATKGKDDSSSDSSEDVSDEDEVKPAPRKDVKATKPTVEESSSSEEDKSSSDEEPLAKAPVPAKKQQVDAKNGPVGPTKKGNEDSSDLDPLDSSDDGSDDDEDTTEKAPTPKKVAVPATNKKAESSDSDSDSDESSDDDDEGAAAKTTTATLKVQTPKKEDSSESDESDSDDSDVLAAKPAVGSKRPSSVAQAKESQQSKMDIEKDDSEDDSSEESDDESPKNKKVKAQKESSSEEKSSSDDSDDEEESEDEKLKKNGTDVEMVDAATPRATGKKPDLKSANKAPKTPVTPEAHTTGSKTLFVGNLSFQVERADVENFFKEAGEIVDVRFAIDKNDQRFRGFGHVEFATTEAAENALKLNGQMLNGRAVKLDLARERGDRTPHTQYSSKEDSFQKGGGGQTQKIFVRGFDKFLGEDEIRSSLEEHFKSCGEITRISIPTDYESGAIKGMAYLEFQDTDGFNKALVFNGSQLGDQYLTVEEAKPKGDNRDGWGSGRGGGKSGGGRSGGRDGGGRFGSRDGGGRFGGRGGGGRGGGRGRGRGTHNKPSVTTASTGKKTTFNDDD